MRGVPSDRALIYAAAFLRAVATGLIGVLLGVYLAEVGLDVEAIGFAVSAGLAGAATASIAVTLLGGRIGPRRALLVLSLLATAGACALAFAEQPTLVALAAFAGMVNGMGRDRGAALVLEQAMLPATVSDDKRTMAFAAYNVLQDLGHALGGLLAGLPTLLIAGAVASAPRAWQAAIGVYALLCLLPVIAYAALSPAVATADAHASAARIAPESRTILWKISSLFFVDSVAGGFLTTALLSWFFHEHFGAALGTIGILFFFARLANAGSHFAAAWLARRIGLVNTMVFTHIPSSLLLISVAYAPSFPVAAALFLLREGLVEMDVPTRQSYVMAVVRPSERTFASGVTHLVRMGAWAIAPAFAGVLMTRGSLMLPLVVGALMKIAYDLLLWRSFRGLKPPEERP